jgi:hypothetical protein
MVAELFSETGNRPAELSPLPPDSQTVHEALVGNDGSFLVQRGGDIQK